MNRSPLRVEVSLFSGVLFFCFVLVSPGGVLAAKEPSGFYEPLVKEIEGWTVKVDPKVLAKENEPTGTEALKALANHLQRIKYIVPEAKVQQLQKLPIWVEWEHSLGAMQYHPSRGWLLANGHDPHLQKHVHIPRAKALLSRSQWAKHPYVVLHELAHAYHDQVLGFEQSSIIEAYDSMKEAGSYERVLLHSGRQAKHYALTNHKEYFAESTEAYFGVNDFYPFVRAELKKHDPKMFQVMVDVWGKID